MCLVLILKFGVLDQVNPPGTTLRGLFVLACVVAGGAGGAVTIFFWKLSRYLIGGWGGFALALFIQCFRNGGLIHEIGFRWIMFIGRSEIKNPPLMIPYQSLIPLASISGLGVAGFCICTIPKIHYHVLLVSTGFVGATAVMLGIDCFTSAGLKEVMHASDVTDGPQFLRWFHSSTCGTLVSRRFSLSTRITAYNFLSRK